jgi:hypothetical protein
MCPVVIIFIQFSPNNSKWQCKKIVEIKFAFVTKDTAETSNENHSYHFITPHETVICDSDGMTGDHNTNFSIQF